MQKIFNSSFSPTVFEFHHHIRCCKDYTSSQYIYCHIYLQKGVLLDTEASTEIPDIKGHGEEGHGRDDNERSRYRGCAALGTGDDTVLTDNLDAFHVVARSIVGGRGGVRGKALFALAGGEVESFAGFTDGIGVGLVVGVLVVDILGFLAGQARGIRYRSFTVRKSISGKFCEGNIFDGRGAGIIGKETHVNSTALGSAVRTNVVLDFVVEVAVLAVLDFELTTAHVVVEVELLLLVALSLFFVRVAVNALQHAGGVEAIVLALLGGPVVGLVAIVLAGAFFLQVKIALVIRVLAEGFVVRGEEVVHVNDVVTVGSGAAGGFGGTAGIAGAETEAHQGSRGNLDVFVTFRFAVPLLDVVATLEFDGIARDPSIGEFSVLVQATRVRQQMLSDGRVRAEFSSSRSGEQSGNSEEHHGWVRTKGFDEINGSLGERKIPSCLVDCFWNGGPCSARYTGIYVCLLR
jgi:hypothetical protein